MTRVVHAVPVGIPGEHQATQHCQCEPLAMLDLLEPSVVVWRHLEAAGAGAGVDTARQVVPLYPAHPPRTPTNRRSHD